uniref:B box-type domain-containing protein n=1 Tax=Opuntia streptacantha TaxID=393608 RepID=A0A7C9A321_OPUST
MAEPKRGCELCSAEATVYCASDSAYLCCSCDAKVHNANFLVARHFRSFICSKCRNLADFRFSGSGISPAARNLCKSCSPEEFHEEDDSLSSSSSSCVSSTTEEEAVSSAARKRREKKRSVGVAVDLKVEGVLVNWCRRMSVDERKSWKVVTTAVELLGGCLNRMTVLPFRVSLAASFWVAMRVCCCLGGDTCRDLRRLEQISGVPAKLILATESRIARAVKRRQSRADHEEGWAEC